MRSDLRRGAPSDLRDRQTLGALVAWCLGLGGMLFVSVGGLPPSAPETVACALFSAAGMLAAMVLLGIARLTPRSSVPGALLEEDGDAFALIIDGGVDPLPPWIFTYLTGMVVLSAGAVRFVNRAHIADAILVSGIAHALLSAVLVRRLGPTLVRVDAQRLEIARGGKLRALPWSELREVGLHRGDLEVTRLDGERVRLRTARLPDDERRRLRARITAGIAAVGPLPARAELLARQGRALPEWRRDLAHLVVDEGYRQRGLSVDEAEAVLDAPRAPAEERVGAAFALAAAGGQSTHARIRAVAATCQDRRLRAALLETTVDEPREATVERALPRADRR